MKKMLNCQKAAVLPLVAVVVMLLILVIAIAVDISRAYTLQNKAQQASDAALLGAVATLNTNSCVAGTPIPDPENHSEVMRALNCEAKKLFYANFKSGYQGSTVSETSHTDVNFNVALLSTGEYELTFDIKLPMELMTIFGWDYLDFNIVSRVKAGYEDYENFLELTLVLDTTDSMNACPNNTDPAVISCPGNDSKLRGLKNSAKGFINALFHSETSLSNVWVSIVPYDMSVNLQNYGNSNWLQTSSSIAEDYRGNYLANTSTDERNNRQFLYFQNRNNDVPTGSLADSYPDVSDASPDTTNGPSSNQTLFHMSRFVCNGVASGGMHPCNGNYASPSTNPEDSRNPHIPPTDPSLNPSLTLVNGFEFMGPKLSATNGTPVTVGVAPILARQQYKEPLNQYIENLTAQYATRIPVGLMWGWFTVSPSWGGIWGTGSPAQYENRRIKKIIILMTDGRNERPSTTALNPSGNMNYLYNPANDNATTLALCNAIRDKGIDLYTVTFGALIEGGTGGDGRVLMQQCVGGANSPFYSHASDNVRLNAVFLRILDKINEDTLRLTK